MLQITSQIAASPALPGSTVRCRCQVPAHPTARSVHAALLCARPSSSCCQSSSRSSSSSSSSRRGGVTRSSRRRESAEQQQHGATCSSCSSSSSSIHEALVSPQQQQRAISRRAGLSGAAASLLWANSQLPAWALRTIELKDGSKVDVYEHGMSLEIVALRGSIPQQWIIDFRQGLGKYAGFQLGQRKQLQELFDELGKPGEKRSAGAADVVTLGDSWIAPAIRQRLIQPVPSAETYRWWRRLPRRWQQLVRRDTATGLLSDLGPVWGCPYRWGGMLLAYKRDLVLRARNKCRPIATWADLLQPALRGRVAFPDNPREFLGIALKTLGHPRVGFNATRSDLAGAGFSEDDVRRRVRELKAQARLFSSQEHVRALITGDVWVCVGSSTDLVPLSERTNSVELLAPADGTCLWADVWTVPAHAAHGHLQSGPSPILPAWLEFSISPARAEALNGLKDGASPLLLPHSAEEHALMAAAVAAATSGGGSSGVHQQQRSSRGWGPGGWLGRGGRQLGETPEAQRAAQEAGQKQQQQQAALVGASQRRLYDAAVGAAPAALQLAQANHFMPPDSVLEQSEFMLPRDSDTLDLYNSLLS